MDLTIGITALVSSHYSVYGIKESGFERDSLKRGNKKQTISVIPSVCRALSVGRSKRFANKS